MQLTTRNHCNCRREKAPSIIICNFGVWRSGWVPRATLQGRNIVFSFFTHVSLCTALLCSRKRNVENAYALFLHFEPGNADDAWNTFIFVTLCIERSLMSFYFWELHFPFWCQNFGLFGTSVASYRQLSFSVLNMAVHGFPNDMFKGEFAVFDVNTVITFEDTTST